jgi:hypothetical protein
VSAGGESAAQVETDETAVTYSIEGYSLNMPVELHTYEPYWGGFADAPSARRMARDLGNHHHRLRLVKVTREVVEDLTSRPGQQVSP